MDDGILERLGVCFGEAGLGGLDGGDAALEDVGGTVDAVLLAHGIGAALISILLAVRDALRNTDGDGLDGLNALGGGDGHGAANADGQALRALFLALEGQNIAEASDITEASAKDACLVVEGGGFILALRGEEDAGELAVELVFELFLDTGGAVLHVVVVNDENIVLGMTAFTRALYVGTRYDNLSPPPRKMGSVKIASGAVTSKEKVLFTPSNCPWELLSNKQVHILSNGVFLTPFLIWRYYTVIGTMWQAVNASFPKICF